MIKARQLPGILILASASLVTRLIRWKFNRLNIHGIDIEPDHSCLLMCNHFSFWDGFLAAYLSFHGIYKRQPMKAFYIMSVEKQLRMNMWMRWFGSFSIAPGLKNIKESLDYAAEILNTPGNILLYFPQGNLESGHVRKIVFQEGINHLVPRIKGKCQLIWSSNLTDYFESLKPSVDFHMLDCGTNTGYDFEKLVKKVNDHHAEALEKQVRFTK